MAWLQERIHSRKVWKTKDLTEAWRQSNTTVTPSTDYPLSQYFLWSLFKGAWWEEINPGEVLEAAASQSLCELSCQFTFLSLCLVPFSLRGVKTAGKQSPSHILNIVWNNFRFIIQVQHGFPDLWWLSCETAYRLSSIRCPAAYDPFFSSPSHHSAELELNPW